jgi:Glycosyl transferase family 2
MSLLEAAPAAVCNVLETKRPATQLIVGKRLPFAIVERRKMSRTRIGAIVVPHSLYPERLFASTAGTRHQVRWYVHYHGSSDRIAEQLSTFSKENDVDLHLHRVNRGLSRSWNEALHRCFADGNQIALLLNDDLFFYEGAFDEFIRFLETETEYSLAVAHGFEPRDGQVRQQGFACCSIGASAIEEIGYFDENIAPAYLEDTDYWRRILLRKLKVLNDTRNLVEHDRSFTLRNNAQIKAESARNREANGTYFIRKWGGSADSARHLVPFNDARLGLKIEWELRSSPYGYPYDRPQGTFSENMAHLQCRGDVWFPPERWIGEPGTRRWIEAVMMGNDPVEYSAILNGGGFTQWHKPGDLCGTRGRSEPLKGIRLRSDSASIHTHMLSLEATFIDGSAVGPINGVEVTCRSPTGAPLEAFRISQPTKF